MKLILILSSISLRKNSSSNQNLHYKSWLDLVFLRSEIRERRAWDKVLAAKIKSVTHNFGKTLTYLVIWLPSFVGMFSVWGIVSCIVLTHCTLPVGHWSLICTQGTEEARMNNKMKRILVNGPSINDVHKKVTSFLWPD